MRDAMGDLRLGLDPAQVVATLARAGFAGLESRELGEQPVPGGRQGKPVALPMFLVRGTRPDGARPDGAAAHSPPRARARAKRITKRITKPTRTEKPR
jgi:hypothetical protein